MSSSAASAAIPMQQRSDDGIVAPNLAHSAMQGVLGSTPGGTTRITYTRAELLALSTSPISTSRAAHLSTAGLPAEVSRSPVERKEMKRVATLNGGASEDGGEEDGNVLAPVPGDAAELEDAGEGRTETATTTEKTIGADEQFIIDL